MAKSCYNQCFTDQRSCCHCYTKNYMNQYSDNEYLYCPGSHCTITSCEEYCEGETGDSSEYISGNCCNHPNDPCCHDCSILFCPIALAIDIITFPLRSAKYHSHKCCKSTPKVIVSEQIQPDIQFIQIEPK